MPGGRVFPPPVLKGLKAIKLIDGPILVIPEPGVYFFLLDTIFPWDEYGVQQEEYITRFSPWF